MTRAAPSGATPSARPPWRAGRHGAYQRSPPFLLRTWLLCRARVKRTVGAGAGPTSVGGRGGGVMLQASGGVGSGDRRGCVVPTGGRQQVQPPRRIPDGPGCWWPASGVCWPPPAPQPRPPGDDRDQPGIGVADPAGLLAHGGLADRGPRPSRGWTLRSWTTWTPRSPNNYPQVRSVLVVRHGYLVYEHYWQGFTASDGHDSRSVTKSFVSRAGRHRPRRGSIGESGPNRRGAAGRPSPRQCGPRLRQGHREAAADHDLRACRRRLVAGRGRQDLGPDGEESRLGASHPGAAAGKQRRAPSLPTATPTPICCRRLWPTAPASPPWPSPGPSCSAPRHRHRQCP